MATHQPNNWFLNPTGKQAIVLTGGWLIGVTLIFLASSHPFRFSHPLSVVIGTSIPVIVALYNYFSKRKK